MEFNRLIPELSVFDLAASRQFYCEVLGFIVEYERAEDGFVFLSKDGNQLMLEQVHDSGWNVGDMQYPLGQGMNLSMEVDDVEALYHRVLEKGCTCFRPLTTSSYQVGDESLSQSEFLIQDPSGYLLRFVGD